MKDKKGIILIVLFVVIIITSLILYFTSSSNKVSSYSDWYKVEETNYSISVVKYDGLLYFDTNLNENEKKGTQIRNKYYCNNKNCDGVYLIEEIPYAIIKDGDNYLIYNYNDNQYRYLNIGKNIDNIDILYYKAKMYGIVVGNEEGKYKIYSFKSNDFVTDYKCTNYMNNEGSLVDNNVICVSNINNGNAKYDVLDLDTGNIKYTTEATYSNELKIISKSKNNSTYYLVPKENSSGFSFGLYNKSFKLITTTNYGFLEVLNNGNAVIKNSDNTYKSFDVNGNVLKTSKNYKKVIKLMEKYIFVIDNDNIVKLIDYNGNVIKNITQNKSSYYFRTDLSGWYKDNNVDLISLVVIDDSLETMSSGIEYVYNPSTKALKEENFVELGYDEKPIIYLYPEKNNTKITLTFENNLLISTSYPKYSNKWEVIANKNGDLKDINGKYYYGLYYEEIGHSKVDFNEGFYVEKEDAISFLEEKLSLIGLNDRERNEFIMYWLPVLEKNGKNLVYFELTDSKQRYNKLNINPKPDSLLRISIHIKKVNKKIKIKEQKLNKFNRIGFAVIEWGGVNHK